MILPKARILSVEVTEVGDELAVFDLLRDRAHRLNASAALVWRHCDGVTTVSEAAELLRVRLGAPSAEACVVQAIRRLAKAGLLAQPTGVVAAGYVSRRELLRAFSLAGLAGWLAPAVTSLTVATPALALPACWSSSFPCATSPAGCDKGDHCGPLYTEPEHPGCGCVPDGW